MEIIRYIVLGFLGILGIIILITSISGILLSNWVGDIVFDIIKSPFRILIKLLEGIIKNIESYRLFINSILVKEVESKEKKGE
jgi:hypothetical protein